jgi:hypothetical protein
MKQVTIYCGEELNEPVTHLLHKHQVGSFVHVPELYGNTMKEHGSFRKDLAWQACAYILFIDDVKVKNLMADLQHLAENCEVQPCLRVTVVPIEQLI